jgi:hypothetical protein
MGINRGRLHNDGSYTRYLEVGIKFYGVPE